MFTSQIKGLIEELNTPVEPRIKAVVIALHMMTIKGPLDKVIKEAEKELDADKAKEANKENPS